MIRAIQFVRRAAQSTGSALHHITGVTAYDTYLDYCDTNSATGGTERAGSSANGNSIHDAEDFHRFFCAGDIPGPAAAAESSPDTARQ